MKIRKIHRICIFFIVVMLFSTCLNSYIIDLAMGNIETDPMNESNNGQRLHAQGDNPNRGFMQGYTTWVVILLIIIVIVIVSYVLITRNMKKQMEQNTKIMQEMLSFQQSKNNTESNQDITGDTLFEKTYQKTLLKFLNYNENRVMKNLIEQNGLLNQSDISRLPNMGKVKASRILRDMKNKGIIVVETHGKINRIHLSDDLKSIFRIESN